MNTSRIRQAVQALTAYTPGEQPADPSVLKLNTNENPYPPSPAVQAVLAGFDAAALRRYPDPACRRLRRALADLHGASPEQIFVGNGSDEVLLLCVRAFVERTGRIGYFDPSYSLYPVLAAIENVGTCPVPLDADFRWTDPDPRATSLFFITNPNAPTGMLHPHRRIRDFAAASPGIVLVDEAYVDFADAHGMDLALSMENVIVARTLSKGYSLAGLRVGYAVGPAALIAALYKIKDSYNVDRLAQDLALAAVTDQAYLRRCADQVRATRDRTAATLAARGYAVSPSQANFLWARPPHDDAEQVFHALRARKILVRYFPGPRTGSHLRITIGTDAEMDRLLDAL
jgi:histidinol-phosphate aminotransferase